MRRRLLLGLFAAAAASMSLAPVAVAHGDDDARPIARGLECADATVRVQAGLIGA